MVMVYTYEIFPQNMSNAFLSHFSIFSARFDVKALEHFGYNGPNGKFDLLLSMNFMKKLYFNTKM
jgi:hypothetical protein